MATNEFKVYLEVGQRRVFAAALDWPGWCRSGRDEASALQALSDYGARYEQAIRSARLGFQRPKSLAALVVVERLKGNAVTDFGAPDQSPASDSLPLDDAELQRLQAILKACWRALDAVSAAAEGKMLSTGPRGGGRALRGIVEHTLGAESAYLSQLGGKAPPPEPAETLAVRTREAVLATLAASARGEIPARGPRGGLRWSARYFIRRDAWHILDHAWEIEDRMQTA